MGGIAPPIQIAPAATDPSRFGLFSIANMPDPTGRWEFGVEWEPIAGERAHLRAHECVDAYTDEVVLRDGETALEGSPFVVVGSYSCKSASRSLEEAEERARLHLNAGEERAVEYEITTGTAGAVPNFQGATDLTPTPGTAVHAFDGVALIEAALAKDYAGVGAVHSPRLLGTRMSQFAERVGQRVETLAGNYVALGGGYDLANVGPAGAAPDAGTVWLYGTGRPTIRRSEVFVQPDTPQYLDRGTNDVAILAQRTYLVTWDGPTVAVLVEALGTVEAA